MYHSEAVNLFPADIRHLIRDMHKSVQAPVLLNFIVPLQFVGASVATCSRTSWSTRSCCPCNVCTISSCWRGAAYAHAALDHTALNWDVVRVRFQWCAASSLFELKDSAQELAAHTRVECTASTHSIGFQARVTLFLTPLNLVIGALFPCARLCCNDACSARRNVFSAVANLHWGQLLV